MWKKSPSMRRGGGSIQSRVSGTTESQRSWSDSRFHGAESAAVSISAQGELGGWSNSAMDGMIDVGKR